MAKKTNVPKEVSAPTLQFIDLSQISPNQLNPRKTFDQTEIQELSDSIKKIGLIQAITVRPKGKDYEIICGERRFHACTLAGLDQIPASVRDLNDSEAMELMVTENLQRKNVSPLEEANAFQFMISKMKYQVEDVSAKVGKPDSYILRRLSLLNLIPLLEEKLKSEELPIGHAELLSRVEIDVQGEWYNDTFNKPWGDPHAGTYKDLRNWLARNVEHLISKATFDTEVSLKTKDGVLNPCSVCSKNTGVQTLFPGEDAKCLDRNCWNIKSEAEYRENLNLAKQDPEIQFVNYSWNEVAEFKKLKSEGFTVLKYNECTKIDIPVLDSAYIPDREDFDTDEEYAEACLETDKEFAEEMAEYEIEIQGATKAFDIVTGTYIYVKVNRSSESKVTSPDQAIKNQIAALEGRILRGRELDLEKIQKKLMEVLPGKLPKGELTDLEAACLNVTIYNQVSWNDKESKESLGIDPYKDSDAVKLQKIMDADPAVMGMVTRKILFNNFRSTYGRTLNGLVLKALAEEWCPEDIKRFELDQEGIRQNREARINKQIEDLKKEIE